MESSKKIPTEGMGSSGAIAAVCGGIPPIPLGDWCTRKQEWWICVDRGGEGGSSAFGGVSPHTAAIAPRPTHPPTN